MPDNFYNGTADISNIPSSYNIPDFTGGQFNDAITTSVQSYFNENPFPTFNLPMSGASPYQTANDQVTDLFKLYQNPNTQGDPYHRNQVKALSVGPNNGFGFQNGGPVQYFNDGGKADKEDPIFDGGDLPTFTVSTNRINSTHDKELKLISQFDNISGLNSNFYKLWANNGRPNINVASKKIRPHFNPLTNTVNVSPKKVGNENILDTSDFLNELSHAKQLKEKGLLGMLTHGAKSYLRDPFISKSGQLRQYNLDNSLEHEAHSSIEPKLKEQAFDQSFSFDTKFIPNFKNGGTVRKYEEGGMVEEPPYVEIQTEKGEVLMMPNGELVNVKAKKSHKKQDKDNVSDIVPQGSYIFSDAKKMRLTKKQADKISLGMSPVYYSEEFEEDDTMTEPKEMKFSDYFVKEKHTPAELAKMIKKKYPINSRQGDSFAALAREENKVGRMPLLALTAALSEQKKQKKQPEQFMYGGGVSVPSVPMPQMSGNLPTPSYFSPSVFTSTLPQLPQVNQYERGGEVPKYPIGGIAAAILPSLIKGGIDFFGNRKQAQNLADTRDQALGYVDQQQAAIEADRARLFTENTRLNGLADNALAQQQQYLSQGTNAATAGILSQNPYVEATDFSNTRSLIAGQRQPYGRSQLNSVAYEADAPLRTLLQNSNRLGRNGDATIGSAVGSSIRNRSSLYSQATLANNQFRNQRLGQLANLESNQSQAYTKARNSTRDNQNRQRQGLADIQTNRFNQLSQFTANDLGNRLALSGALSNSLDRNQNSLFNSYNSRLAALGLNAPISQYNANGVNALANTAGQITGNIFDYYTSGNPNGNARTNFTPAATLNGSLSGTDFTQIPFPG